MTHLCRCGILRNDQKYQVEFNDKSDSLPDSVIHDELLKALYRIRKLCPKTYKEECECVDVDGFCDVLDISKDKYLLSAGYLAEEELIESPSMDTGYIYITLTGVKKVDFEINKPRMGFGP